MFPVNLLFPKESLWSSKRNRYATWENINSYGAVIMWKLTNWPKVKQQGIMLGSETPGLKGNCQ